MMLLKPKSRERKRGHSDAVPTDSVSDVAFLLIIFFILTTTIHKITGLTTDFPSSQKEQQATKNDKKAPTVNLKDQQIIFNDKPVSLEELRKQLQSLRLDQKAGEEKVVVFEATGQVTYQNYFQVMALITKSGGLVGIIREK